MQHPDTPQEDIAETLGARLGHLAKARGVSALRIAKATGATRQTVYNWISGGEVAPAYRNSVLRIIKVLALTVTSDDAWSNICKAFGIRG